MEKNNEMLARFKAWAEKQGINYSNADLSAILADMFKWSKTDGQEYFNRKSLTIRDPQRIKEIADNMDALSKLILDSDPDASIETREHYIAVTTDYLGLYPDEMPKYLAAISSASHIDITPTDNNKVSIFIEYDDGEIKVKLPKRKA